MITIGEITGVHGVKGYVKIRSFADSPTIFAPGISLFLCNSDKAGTSGNYKKSIGNVNVVNSVNPENGGAWYKIESATPHKKGIIALFEGLTREIAEKLVGKHIYLSKDDLPELEDDTYYWEDLTGLGVVDINLGYIGVIDHIIPTGSNDVFVVKSKHGSKENSKVLHKKEILVPALSWIILSVDLDKREMTVDLPEGLKE